MLGDDIKMREVEKEAERAQAEERVAASWARTLEQIPTQFGRLVYLAGLRNANSGRYLHHGLKQACGAEAAESIIRTSHEEAFAGWLSRDLREQHDDLETYLRDVGEDRRAVLETWGVLEPYKALPPAAAGEPERLLYETDLEIILDLLRAGSAATSEKDEA